MQKTKLIALIGCGIWGKKILRTLINLGADVIVFETSETNNQQAVELGAREAILCDNDFAQHLNVRSIDGIIVASPSSTHRDVILEILDLHIPLFIEKPLTTDLDDARDIASKSHDNVFMMHIWQYHPGILMLADIAKSKELGDVLQVKTTRANWTSPRIDTDTLWNFMSHDLSIFNTILGYIPSPQYATAETHNNVIRDMTAIFGTQPVCTTLISNRFERKLREVRVHCRNGIAKLKSENDKHIELIHGNDQSFEPAIERRPLDNKTALQAELETFLLYLDGGEPPLCDIKHGLEIIETIDTLYKLTLT